MKKFLAGFLCALLIHLPALVLANDEGWNDGLGHVGASSPVTFDSTATSAANCAGSNTCTVTITVGAGSNRLLIIAPTWHDNVSTPTITGVAITGCMTTAATHLSGAAVNPGANGDYGSDLWYVIAPTSGSCTATVTASGVLGDFFYIGALAFASVSQTTPFGTVATANGTTTSPTLNATGCTAAFDYAIGIGSGPVFTTLTNGNTSAWSFTDTLQASGGQYQACGSGTMSWSGFNNFAVQTEGLIAVAVKAFP